MNDMKSMWDQRYSVSEYIYGTEPNGFFREQIAKLKAGMLLLPGEGEGRNGVYAALLGWEVHAFDMSNEAKTKALKLASLKKVNIHYIISDIESAVYPVSHFDAIALIYVHLAAGVRTKYHNKLLSFLKPGGTLLLEAYSKEQITRNSGGPKDTDMLYEVDELLNDFSELDIIDARKEIVVLDEGHLHKGEASVIRLLARK